MEEIKKESERIIHEFRLVLMNDGEDYGEEVLVSVLCKKFALICCDKIMSIALCENCNGEVETYWKDVREYIEQNY